jgi:hypothetical protein
MAWGTHRRSIVEGSSATYDSATRRCGPCTHHDEREGAARVNRDAPGVREQDAGAVASSTAAGKRGGRSSGEVDAADAPVVPVL